MSHDEASELLAVAALHAVDAETLAAIEEHAATCPRCQSELDGYRAVAAALGNSVEELPEGLWTNISSQLWERKGDVAAMPPLVVGDTPADVVAIGTASPRSRRVRAAVGALALAAAASIVVLALSLSSAQNHVTNLQAALKVASRSAVQRAMATPGHQVVDLTSATDQQLAKFVMLPDGTGYLVKSTMPALASNDTYQLWGIVNGSPVSIGVMGSSPGQVTFTLNASPGPTELAVTVQKAGGSLTPAKRFVASGPVVAS
ncbi:MAG: anti-sigma factor [Acidimicrobiales bacterium]